MLVLEAINKEVFGWEKKRDAWQVMQPGHGITIAGEIWQYKQDLMENLINRSNLLFQLFLVMGWLAPERITQCHQWNWHHTVILYFLLIIMMEVADTRKTHNWNAGDLILLEILVEVSTNQEWSKERKK